MKTRNWILAGAGLAVLTLAVLWIGFFKPGEQAPSEPRGHVHGSPSVPVEPEPAGEEEPPVVEITEDMQRLIGVKTAAASMSAMTRTLRLTGRIEEDEQALFTVNTKVEGWIERLYADYTGRYLKRGEPLVEIYNPELIAAQQELIDLSAWQLPGDEAARPGMLEGDARRLQEAARKRLRLWDISEAQIEQILKNGRPMRSLTIASPVSGYVVKRYAAKGMRVMAGEPLLDIADLSRVWVVAEVNEADAGMVRVGMPVRMSVSGLPGRTFSSEINFIYPTLNPQTRTLRIRCTLENPGLVLKPQMFAEVELRADLGRRLAVPEDAVMDTGENRIVYVARGEGLFEPRTVETGVRAEGLREILSGLAEGEKVAASALFLIDSEAQLKGVAPAAP